MKKKFFLIICLFLLVGCGNTIDDNNSNDSSNNESNIDDIVEKKVSIIDVDSKTRPYAVMINCHNASLPQSGLDKAYIVYELMVEGGITRMMALFKDVDFDKVGSVRSARTQYLDYVYENDAIYAHAGGATDALQELSGKKTDVDVDGIYGMRDKTLNRAWEHTLFTSSNLLNTAVSKKGFNTVTDKPNLLTYSADEIDLSKYKSAIKANDISIKYSNYRTSIYKYDNDIKKYLRYMNDKENTDLTTGLQYTAKNIIVYGVTYTTYTYDGYTGYQKISNIGSGEGYYITSGYAIPITWEKDTRTSQTVYKIKETSEKLVVNDGNTYIQIYPSNKGELKIN